MKKVWKRLKGSVSTHGKLMLPMLPNGDRIYLDRLTGIVYHEDRSLNGPSIWSWYEPPKIPSAHRLLRGRPLRNVHWLKDVHIVDGDWDLLYDAVRYYETEEPRDQSPEIVKATAVKMHDALARIGDLVDWFLSQRKNNSAVISLNSPHRRPGDNEA